jgi:hypothetical protein
VLILKTKQFHKSEDTKVKIPDHRQT